MEDAKMVKFENTTSLKDFRKMVDNGKYVIEKLECGDVRITHNLYPSMPYFYRLKEIENGSYLFSSENDIPFSIHFRQNSNNVEILEAEKEGRKYKADKFLKGFMKICTLPSSVLLAYAMF